MSSNLPSQNSTKATKPAKPTQRAFLVKLVWSILGLALLGVIAWWLSTIEKTWTAIENPSTAFSKNPMVAATRLLEKRQYLVQVAPILTEQLIKSAPKGTMIIADNDGYMSKQQADALFAWIAEGNTLITFPKLSSTAQAVPSQSESNVKGASQDAEQEASDEAQDADEDTEEDTGEAKQESVEKTDDKLADPSTPKQDAKRVATPLIRDPIGEYLGVSTIYDERTGIKYFHSTLVTIPESPYALKLRKPNVKLQTKPGSHTALFTDEHADTLRVYTFQKGHIAVLSENIFELQGLRYYDHAELLLALIKLNPKNQAVTIVQRLKIPTWYELLWNAFPFALCLLGASILLLFWRAVRRFGPLLPETNWERRSLMEHIEASGRWAWSTTVGRDLLLSAVRTSTKLVLQKRAPELQKLSVNDQVLRMAQVCHMDHEQLAHAWLDAASHHPHLFTRQIQHLQQLRAHYEHKS